MVPQLIFYLAVASITASLLALLILVFGSFKSNEKEEETEFVKRESRTIKIKKTEDEPQGINTQVPSLLSTVAIGQLVGIYFLFAFLEISRSVVLLLRLNGAVLLLITFICSILTIFNATLKLKMAIQHRLLFQGYSFVVGLIVLRLSIGKHLAVKEVVRAAGLIPSIVIGAFYSTVVLAIFLMFLIGSTFRKAEQLDYNFNKYFMLVVGVGIFIGTLLLVLLKLHGN